MNDIDDYYEENVLCGLCGIRYTQCGPAGYGKCSNCFFEIVDAEIKMTKEWAKTPDGIECMKKYEEEKSNE